MSSHTHSMYLSIKGFKGTVAGHNSVGPGPEVTKKKEIEDCIHSRHNV